MDQEDGEDYSQRVMLVVDRVSAAMQDSPEEFGVIVSALVTLLATAGTQSQMSQPMFCNAVMAQLDELMTHLSGAKISLQ
jgi:hypothetical protein